MSINMPTDSFLLVVGIPKDQKGYFPLPAEAIKSHRAKAGVKEVAQEGRTLESMSPQQQMPRIRGKPRKNKEVGETRVPSKLHRRSLIEELLMCSIQLELIEGASQESWSRTRRTNTVGTNVREPSQQLKKAQLANAKLYQENRELKRQLEAKTLKVLTSQDLEENMTWFKRQLQEAQDTIV